MSHKYTIQLYTGNFTKAEYSIKEIKETCHHLLKRIKVKNVILGWNTDKDLNNELVSYFHEQNITVLLWFPVLAKGDQIGEFKQMTMLQSETQTQKTGSFACPSYLPNAHEIIKIYEQHFADIPFDGIFLDKIRFASFSDGYEAGFGCFCEDCEKQMISVDLPYIKHLIQTHDKKLLRGEYDDFGRYHFADYHVNTFYKRRAQIITDLVFKLAAYFNSRKLIVGADVYAPVLAYHVGQNIKEIGRLVDFVKPMLYSHTNAPGGIAYEYDSYIRNFETAEPFTKHFLEGPLSHESLRRQLDYLSNLPANVVPSIEINPIAHVCDISAADVKDHLNLFSQYSTIALSWDIMKISDEIIEVL